MEDTRFDDVTKAVGAGPVERRKGIKSLVGAGLGLALGGLALGQPAAKAKKKKRPPCPPACTRCTAGNDATGCCRIECCLGIDEPTGGLTFCRPADTICCTSAEGGGACSRQAPYCCPPTLEFPEGFCTTLPDSCDDVLRGAVGTRLPRIGRAG